MKKITSLILTALMLAAMLSVFALPASAETDYIGKWVKMEDGKQAGLPRTIEKETFYHFVIEFTDPETNLYGVITYKYETSNSIIRKRDIQYYKTDSFCGIVDSTEIPQAVLNMAAQDYPELFPTSSTPTENGEGSILSDGNLWIIIAVAVIALGGIAAIVIVKKKKA